MGINASRLEHRLGLTGFDIPGHIRSDKAEGYAGLALAWDETASERVEPPDDLLQQFIGLGGPGAENRERILQFASRYGPLCLCYGHAAPISDCRAHSRMTSAEKRCEMMQPEPLLAWYAYATHAKGIVWLSSALAREDSAQELDRAAACVFFSKPKTGLPSKESEWHQMLLQGSVGQWMPLLEPLVYRKGRREFRFDLAGLGLLGSLAKRLVNVVLGNKSWAMCHECGTLFSPTRKPRVIQRAFCPRCRENKAPQKWAARSWRARQRGSRSQVV